MKFSTLFVAVLIGLFTQSLAMAGLSPRTITAKSCKLSFIIF